MEPTIDLGDGLHVPRLGFGTSRLRGDVGYDSVRAALEIGYRHVDTAQSYGNEAQVGQAVADSGLDRAQVFLTTKIQPFNAAPADVRSSTLQSLADLGVDHVELLLLHWPAEDVAPLGATLEAMTQLRDEGLARAIGVSNFPSAMLARAVALAPIVTNQVEHHVFLHVDPIRAVLREHGGFLTAYSPLAQGAVTEPPLLREIADGHGVTPAQVALRWLLQQRETVVIPRSANPEHIRTNLDVLGFTLDDDELRRLDTLDEGRRLIDPAHAPVWD